MTDEADDDDVVELTADLIAGEGQEAAAAPVEPKTEAPAEAQAEKPAAEAQAEKPAAEAPAGKPAEEAKKKLRPPPANPFTLLVQPQPEPSRERVSAVPTEPRESRSSFVPDPNAPPVAAIPIRKVGAGGAPATAEPAPPAAAGGDEEIMDLGQELVVDGQVSDTEVGAEPIPLTRPSAVPAQPSPQPPVPEPDEPMAAVAGGTPPAEPDKAPEADEGEPLTHPFDFGTPEMVFDRVAEADAGGVEEAEDVEEVDAAELEEEGGEAEAEAEPEGEEIDLAEVEEVQPTGGERPVPLAVPAVPGAAGPRKRRRKTAKEWWASIFDDDFLAVMPAYPKRDVRRDLDLIVDSLNVEPGGLVLDLACGAGRHAIGMARRNYRVVGVDLSLSMLARAGELAQEADQKINFIHGDMRDLGFDQTFDGIYCLGTSFGYFDDQVNVKVIEGVHRALKPGGNFLLEIANRDHAITRQPNLLWFEMGDVISMEETDFNYINSRLYVSRNVILDGGQRQTKHEYSVRLYSLHEIGQIMHNSGFAVTRVSGHVSSPGAFFGVDSQKLIIVAQRRR